MLSRQTRFPVLLPYNTPPEFTRKERKVARLPSQGRDGALVGAGDSGLRSMDAQAGGGCRRPFQGRGLVVWHVSAGLRLRL